MDDTPGIQFGGPSHGPAVVSSYNLELSGTDSLRGALGELAAKRSRFSLAHELAHVVLSHADDDHVAWGKAIKLLSLAGELRILPTGFLGSVTTPPLTPASIHASPDSGLLPWHTPVRFRLSLVNWPIHDSAPAVSDRFLSVRLSGGATRLLTDVRKFIEHLASLITDVAAAAIRKIDKLRAAICAGLASRLALLAGNPDIRAFVLVILAASRRYGRRSEPDDHNVQPMRRYPTSRGVIACA